MKVLFLNHNGVLNDIEKEFESTTDITKAKAVVMWSDVTMFNRSILEAAKRRNIKTIVVQHGRKGSSRYYEPFNEPILADKILVWGDYDKQSLTESGHPESKVKVVGTTILNHLKGKKEHKGINVVFCPEHWDKQVEENILVRDELRKLKGVNLITKIIESHNPSEYDNPIQTDRASSEHLDICIEVLQTADLVVGISESTFELLAQAMDIPVVIMEEWKPKPFGGDMNYLTYKRVISRAAKKTTVKNLLKTIKQQLKNPDELKEERKQVVIEEGGLGLNSLELIKQEIWKN